MSTATIPKMEPLYDAGGRPRSSNMDAIGYDPETHALHVRFKSGDHYVYEGVPAETHAKLMSEPSMGGYLHRHIKGVFKHRKL